jgi:hypothetical protein
MSGIFETPYAQQLTPSTDAKRAYTTLVFEGEDKPVTFNMIEESRANQPARLQIDATLDGNLHVIGTSTGVGEYAAVFYEGPICGKADADNASVMQKYMQLKTIKSRRAIIYFYGNTDANTATAGSKSSHTAKFSGIINNMGVSMIESSGLVYIRVALSMLGMWGE